MKPLLALSVLVLFSTSAPPTTCQEQPWPTDPPWEFRRPFDPDWVAQHNEKLAAIEAWWKAFAEKAPDIDAQLSGKQAWDLAEWMDKHLQSIDSRLMWEYGPGLQGGRRLVITPGKDRQLHPLVVGLINRAPKCTGWEFYPTRRREPATSLESILAARSVRSLESASVAVSVGDLNRVDLTFVSPDFEGPGDGLAEEAALVATEVLLGEDRFYTWVGRIRVAKSVGAEQRLFPLADLSSRVAIAASDIRDQHIPVPIHETDPEQLEWTFWNVDPNVQDDYAGQQDLVIGKSILPPMWQAARSGVLFSSDRYTTLPEFFIYVKVDSADGLAGSAFKSAGDLEAALDAALRNEKRGGVVGGGTGLRYLYVDLAVIAYEGVRIVKNTLAEGKVPKRSWILFFDSTFENEWVGVYDDTPPPPR